MLKESLIWLSAFRWREKYFQRSHHLVLNLSGDFRILFVETRFSLTEKLRMLSTDPRGFFVGRLSQVASDIHVLSVYSLFPRRLSAYIPLLNRVNGWMMAERIRKCKTGLGMGSCVAGTCSPYHYLHVIGKLEAWTTFYDCIDEHAEFRFAPPWSMRMEQELMAKVAHVFASSLHLQRTRERLSGKRVHYIPNAVDSRFFEAGDPAFQAHREGAPPVIGFIGYFGEWIDFELLDFLMGRLSHCRFVLAGEGGLRGNWRLRRLARSHGNCECLGLIPYRDVPALAAGFDAALIPFRDCRLVDGVSPIKLFEYASQGIPIVATRWQEIEQYAIRLPDSIRLASTPGQFLDHLSAVLTSGRQPRLREFARQETWQSRAREMSRILASPHAHPSPA